MSNKVSNILVAAVAGVAAGVVLGLLFAPEKGTETRKKIRKFLEDMTDEFGENLEEKFGPLKEIFRKEDPSAPVEPGDETSGK